MIYKVYLEASDEFWKITSLVKCYLYGEKHKKGTNRKHGLDSMLRKGN